jgi:hypothetical protein
MPPRRRENRWYEEEAFALHTVEELCAALASEDAVIAAAQARRCALIREFDRREGCITGAARDLTPPQFEACAKRLVTHLADNGGDTLDERDLERRELVIWTSPTAG